MLIAVEGVDGAGKTTLTHALKNRFGGARSVVSVHTPSPKLRSMCLELRGVNPRASFLAFMIGNTIVRDACENTDIVLADRYLMSTLVHHRDVLMDAADQILEIVNALRLPRPDLTLLLDVNIETARRRLCKRSADNELVLSLSEQRDNFLDVSARGRHPDILGPVITARNEVNDDLHNNVETVVAVVGQYF